MRLQCRRFEQAVNKDIAVSWSCKIEFLTVMIYSKIERKEKEMLWQLEEKSLKMIYDGNKY